MPYFIHVRDRGGGGEKMEISNYNTFLESKKHFVDSIGIDIDLMEINKKLFDFQKDIVKFACKKGRCAIFLDT